MTRNTELHFANLPSVKIGRSKFDKSFTHKTTFSAGKLYPIYVDSTIMPGDSVKMSMSEVIRMMTPICPVMDNAYEDIYFFFVPHRLVWKHFKEFMGENTTAPWVQTINYTIPQLSAPKLSGQIAADHTGWTKGSIADYFGIPTEVTDFSINALPFRAYALIWNEFFRDENIMYPQVTNYDSDSTQAGYTIGSSNQNNYPLFSAVCGGKPLPVCKLHDYFTSCLPNSQKGAAVTIPVGTEAPIKFGDAYMGNDGDTPIWYPDDGTGYNALIKSKQEEIEGENKFWSTISYELDDHTPKENNVYYATENYMRMYADLTAATGATVNQLRQAFAIQKFLERDARNGTRFIELIQSHFNVTNPDYRLQRPEYLGGKRIPINMNTVVQNSPEVSDSTPLGTTGAYSVTSDNDEFFTKSFTEWGTLIGLICVRTDRTYQQGLNKMWTQKDKFDYYFPEFANLGEEMVANREIYLQGSSVVDSDGNIVDEQAFGYQERWANYRYTPDIVTGEMRSNYAQSLDIWHYADYYDQLPTLSPEWLEEDDANIERTLAVQNHDQFLGDFFFKTTYTRPMPLYSVPGLIDHH